MSHHAKRHTPGQTTKLTPHEQLRAAREILRLEAKAIWELSDRLNKSFCQTVELLSTTVELGDNLLL